METNVKQLNSFKKTTVSIVTISLIIAAIWTVVLALYATGVFGTNEPTNGLIEAYKGSTTDMTDGGLIAIGAGLSCTGLLGAGIGQGYAGGKAAEAVGRNPEAEGKIRNMMIVGAAIAESSALYALVIAIIILFAY